MNRKQVEFYKEMEKAIFNKFKFLFEKAEQYDWIEYRIDKYDGNSVFEIQIDFRRISFMLSGTGKVYLTVSEVGCIDGRADVNITLTTVILGCDVEQRTIVQIINDYETLINIFWKNEFYKYLSMLIECSKDKSYSLEYHEWHAIHSCYEDMKKQKVESKKK